MPLRCLVFSSHEEMIQPIWQVLADLGVEGEYCASAVDAVERVTTQLFQIVVTDWDDQPEAAFLLKTARDLKAAHRPLTLAIVGDDAKLPEALRAGANSVLVKPIRAEQVRDTMSTACELLRAKQQPAGQRAATVVEMPEAGEKAALTAAAVPAAAGAVSATISRPPSSVSSFSVSSFSVSSSSASSSSVASAVAAPSSVTQSPERTFRAGEFLQPRNSAPGAQFDTEEKEAEVAKSVEQAGADEVEALTELEPMAAAVEEAPAQESQPEAQQPMTGWAALQARLTRSAPAPAKEIPAKSELLSYDETSSSGAAAEHSSEGDKNSAKPKSAPESKSEAALFAYMPGETVESSEVAEPHSKRGRIFVLGIVAAACLLVAAGPRGRQGVQTVVRGAVRAGGRWLNPPPTAVPQAAPQHDSFGQSGDEYKLPVVANIPDATTDPSQIRVLPVVDPTAKPEKNAETNGGQVQAPDDNSSSNERNPSGESQSESGQAVSNSPGPSQSGPSQNEESPVKESSAKESPAKNAPTPSVVERSANAAERAAVASSVQANRPEEQSAAPQVPRPAASPAHRPATPHAVTVATNAGIPSSLKTQMASSTPEASGNKPPEAAMSSIEPVSLPESAVRDLLVQPVDPEYPAGAKATGQRGSVVLQVIIGRDGAVRDAKFLQGSLVFARAAIDAVKQWRFKPYSMNGRAVSVQSVITLSFKPPA